MKSKHVWQIFSRYVFTFAVHIWVNIKENDGDSVFTGSS